MFAAAIALATPASMLAQAVSQVLIPQYAHWLEEDRVEARRRHVRVLVAMTGILLIAFGVVAVLAPWLVPVLYGPGYEGAVPLLRLLLAGVFLFSVGLIATSFLITSWRTVPATIAAGFGSVLGVVVMVAALATVGWSLRMPPAAPERLAVLRDGSLDEHR